MSTMMSVSECVHKADLAKHKVELVAVQVIRHKKGCYVYVYIYIHY